MPIEKGVGQLPKQMKDDENHQTVMISSFPERLKGILLLWELTKLK